MHGSDAVLVASFTKAAANEIAGRGLAIDERNVSTLHSHAFRAVGHAKIADEILEDWNASAGPLALSVGTRKASQSAPEADFEQAYRTEGDRLRARYEALRNKLIRRELWPLAVQGFAVKWEAWKRDQQVIDFTDMIELALANTDAPLGRPKIGFFDEAQDFTPLELALMRKWAASMDYVVAAGDDDQTIYEFKGASPDAFLDDAIPEDDKRVLAQSYRVPASVQRLASWWIGKVSRRQPKQYRPRADEDGVPVEGETRLLPDANYLRPSRILRDVEPYLAAGKRVLFLASCSYMLDPMIGLLRQEGIPFHNPLRANPKWNPLGGRRGATRGADRLLAYLRPDPDVWGQHARMWDRHDLKMWLDLIKSDGLLVRGAKTKVASDLELDAEDVLALFDPDAPDFGDILSCSLPALRARLAKKHEKGIEFPLTVAERRGAAALVDDPQIAVGTIHSYKGGEADVVYLCPDLSGPGFEQWLDVRGPNKDPIIRLLYVGMTRAKESLILCGEAGATAVPLRVLAEGVRSGGE